MLQHNPFRINPQIGNLAKAVSNDHRYRFTTYAAGIIVMLPLALGLETLRFSDVFIVWTLVASAITIVGANYGYRVKAAVQEVRLEELEEKKASLQKRLRELQKQGEFSVQTVEKFNELVVPLHSRFLLKRAQLVQQNDEQAIIDVDELLAEIQMFKVHVDTLQKEGQEYLAITAELWLELEKMEENEKIAVLELKLTNFLSQNNLDKFTKNLTESIRKSQEWQNKMGTHA